MLSRSLVLTVSASYRFPRYGGITSPGLDQRMATSNEEHMGTKKTSHGPWEPEDVNR
jgi:hypothetical protein